MRSAPACAILGCMEPVLVEVTSQPWRFEGVRPRIRGLSRSNRGLVLELRGRDGDTVLFHVHPEEMSTYQRRAREKMWAVMTPEQKETPYGYLWTARS